MNDPVVDEIRRVRKVISAEIGPDISQLSDYYRRFEAEFLRPPLVLDKSPPDECVEAGDPPAPDGSALTPSR